MEITELIKGTFVGLLGSYPGNSVSFDVTLPAIHIKLFCNFAPADGRHGGSHRYGRDYHRKRHRDDDRHAYESSKRSSDHESRRNSDHDSRPEKNPRFRESGDSDDDEEDDRKRRS